MLPLLITVIKGAITVAPAVEAAIRIRRAQQTREAVHDLETQRAVLEQTWRAFEFQMKQRNFGLWTGIAAIAIFVAACAGALIAALPVLAAVVAGAGALIVAFLSRFDAVFRARIRVTEKAFHELDGALVAAGEPSRAALVPATSGLSQAALVLVFHTLAFWGFVAAMVYAIVDAA